MKNLIIIFSIFIFFIVISYYILVGIILKEIITNRKEVSKEIGSFMKDVQEGYNEGIQDTLKIDTLRTKL